MLGPVMSQIDCSSKVQLLEMNSKFWLLATTG